MAGGLGRRGTEALRHQTSSLNLLVRSRTESLRPEVKTKSFKNCDDVYTGDKLRSEDLRMVLTFWYLPVFNAWLLLCPWTLAHDWQMGSIPLITSIIDTRNIASLLFYGALVLILRAGCLMKGQEGRALLLGLALLVLPFLPATNLLFTVGFVIAERILYIPSLGYAVLVGVALSRAGRLRAPCLLLLLVAASCRTLQRNRDWESRETLFLAGLRTLPHNAKMHYNFANLQKDLGNADLAKLHYIYAIR
nr:protein O-mannosyl-transferase TMTC1-like [Procambarus clarkii]